MKFTKHKYHKDTPVVSVEMFRFFLLVKKEEKITYKQYKCLYGKT